MARHEASDKPGMIMSIKALIGTCIDLVHTRGRLIANEIEEEWLRFERRMLLMFMAIMFGGLGLVFLSTFLVLVFWSMLGAFGILCFSLIYVAMAGIAVWQLRCHIRDKPSLLSVSLDELKKDSQTLGKSDEKT
ncbi:MAG: phage holin family protein [Proteobacteria bacterium]|nr:phage holin family protein [Pseudomonadota bacterium]MDE3208580.1 phage holin family protein [Pseudomonadota bacterium]